MKALITGASSGIGEQIAFELEKYGCELILVARRDHRLNSLKNRLKVKSRVIVCDLSVPENCIELYNKVKDENIDILVNNAGFGVFGRFNTTDLAREISMINTNIVAVHILTKLFLCDFINKNKGYILNVASSAAFAPGPLFSSYYATKAYVLRLTQAIKQELAGTDVHICALCPGPVDTEFNSVADVRFSIKGLTGKYVAHYAVKKMFQNKTVIVPGFTMKVSRFLSKIIPDSLTAKATYRVQKKKEG